MPFKVLYAQEIVFNEVMSSNTGTLWDEDNDTPDWLEIYNNSPVAVDLGQYMLNDTPDTTGAWYFPSYLLESGKYLLVYASSKDKKDFPLFWETIITQGDSFRYIVPTSEPSSLWRTVSFDDTSWGEGKSGFGYGDGDDNTIIANGSVSVFIRKTFTIDDISNVKDAILHMDYDDGFVAYVNGVEIARANISSTGAPVYNQWASGNHDAVIFEGGTPTSFPIDDVASVFVEGENVLAIQVHNVSASSSDMSAIPFLSIGSDVSVSGSVVSYIEIPLARFHTNFKISADGETLYLLKNNLVTDSVQVPVLPTDVSYGRNETGDLSWKYFSESTPEAINNTTPYDTLSSNVTFSQLGGVYNFTVNVKITSENSGDKIYYTTDATEPTSSSKLYTGPISISNPIVLRAKVINQGAMPGATESQCYLFGLEHDIPIISLITDPANFFDDYTGIYVTGAIQHPLSGKDCDNGQNFWQDWERPIHVSMFNTSGIVEFDQNAGVKIFGGCSRTYVQKSLSLRFRKAYEKDGLKYKMYENLDVDKFYSINLRNSGNDWNNTMMRDGLMGNLFPKQLDKQAFRPAVVYLNGQYWGIHNIRERLDEDYVSTHYDIDDASVDMMEFHVNMKLNEIEGDGQSYVKMLDYIEQNGVSLANNYNHVKSIIDVENFALYQACNIMVKNTDWPGNNVKFWKSEESDNKWRWMVYDLDFGFNDVNHNTLEFALAEYGPNWPNPPASTYLLRKLTENNDFRYLFINSFADVLNTLWLPSNINSLIDKMSGDISNEIQAHMTRWGGNYSSWSYRINDLKTFAANRPAVVRNFVRNYYGINGLYTLNLNVSNNAHGGIKLNTIQPNSYPWAGTYFNNIPVTLIAKPAKGYRFVKWQGASTATTDTIVLNKSAATSVTAVFEEDDNYEDIIVINEIFFTSLTGESPNDWLELYNSSSNSVDLSNWMIKDEDDTHVYVIPEGTEIAANDYLVFCRDTLAFESYYGSKANGNLSFGFGNTADCVRLYNYQEVLVDSVGYINTLTDNTLFSNQRFIENNTEVWYSISNYGTPKSLNVKGTVLSVSEKTKIEELTVSVSPNPFIDDMMIKFYVRTPGEVSISLYTLSGEMVDVLTNDEYQSGSHIISWNNGRKLVSGVYLMQVKNCNQIISIKVIKK